MSVFAMMFGAASIATAEMKRAVAFTAGGNGARFKKNKRTVGTARALLLAYALQAKAKRDISMLLRI